MEKTGPPVLLSFSPSKFCCCVLQGLRQCVLGILVNWSLDHAPWHPSRQACATTSPSTWSCQSPNDVRGVRASGRFSAFIVAALPAAFHAHDHSLPEMPFRWLPGSCLDSLPTSLTAPSLFFAGFTPLPDFLRLEQARARSLAVTYTPCLMISPSLRVLSTVWVLSTPECRRFLPLSLCVLPRLPS